MKRMHQVIVAIILLSVIIGCDNSSKDENKKFSSPASEKGTYAYDADFLRKHTKQVVELYATDGSAKILLSADYQGRVMTSTATGDTGLSFGWLNYDLISSRSRKNSLTRLAEKNAFGWGLKEGSTQFFLKRTTRSI